MRTNYCIGGDLDGKTLECDENHHVHRCDVATPAQDYFSNSIDTPPMIESECQIYHYEIIATGKGRDSIHLMVYNIEQTDIMKHLINGYCEGRLKMLKKEKRQAKIKELLASALRQYCHNNGDPGVVFGYDLAETERIVFDNMTTTKTIEKEETQ